VEALLEFEDQGGGGGSSYPAGGSAFPDNGKGFGKGKF
jgi:hypothetical protein